MINKDKIKAFNNALVKLRNSITDEQAIKVAAIYPAWKEGVSYEIGERVLYNETLYKVLTMHTSQTDWTPNAAPSLFAKVLIPDPETVPEWEQPDSTNPYAKGDKVMHHGKTWISDINGNVWEPGIYGWSEVAE